MIPYTKDAHVVLTVKPLWYEIRGPFPCISTKNSISMDIALGATGKLFKLYSPTCLLVNVSAYMPTLGKIMFQVFEWIGLTPSIAWLKDNIQAVIDMRKNQEVGVIVRLLPVCSCICISSG